MENILIKMGMAHYVWSIANQFLFANGKFAKAKNNLNTSHIHYD